MSYTALSPELDLNSIFPFELDQFQLDAIVSLNAGNSVVVCAPTGSGKTLIGEYAIYRALARGKRVFYTTPLKALSNQKLRDFREKFGHDLVGLLTGDASINRDAPILVMTTEIFRNMLYGTSIGQVGTSLVDVEAVVLDECHYMNDRQRGTVWEESIIYCPQEIQLAALSATVANSDQLTDWLNKVHGPTDLIYSDFRPVPLEFYFGNSKGLFPLLDDNKKAISPRLKKRGKRDGDRKTIARAETPTIDFILSKLHERDMLPAIYFIFSRKGCDKAVGELGDLWLVNQDEARELRRQIDDFLTRNPEAGRPGQVGPLYRGIAAHHAGILPAWKSLVEELFQQGLIKVVFATETLAAGINMPARTTVISSLSKRTDTGHRLLNASEFLQMAGRAGRRGMDKEGHVVTLQTPFEGAKDAADLATRKADPLKSHFTPSYGMVLNLLQTHTLEKTRELVERSFGQYLANLHLKPQFDLIDQMQEQLGILSGEIAAVDEADVARYEKLRERLKVERQILKTLQEQARETRGSEMTMLLSFAVSGTLLSLKGKNILVSKPITAVLVGKTPGSGQAPYLVCLGQDNRWYVATTADVVDLYAEIPRIDISPTLLPPAEMPLKPGQSRKGNQETSEIAVQIPIDPSNSLSAPHEVMEQMRRVEALQEQIQAHPLHQTGSTAGLFKRRARYEEIQEQYLELQAEVEQKSRQYWEEFINLITILQHFDALNELVPTQLGQIAASLRGENELWLGLSLASGVLDNLDPQHLAAVAAALVTETPRPDTFVRFSLSSEADEAWSGLQQIRRSVLKVQYRHGVALPVGLESRYINLISVVEQWALGIDWTELCENTTLDEGDVVRILRRTLDLLSQIPHVPNLSSALYRNAHRAMQLIDRFPVNEVVE